LEECNYYKRSGEFVKDREIFRTVKNAKKGKRNKIN